MAHACAETDLKTFFEEIGSRYDTITSTKSFQYFLQRRRQYLREWLNDGPAKAERVVVDLAAGTGTYSDSISRSDRLINMDLSFNALRSAPNGEGAPVRVNADALRIPLRDRSVDVLLMIGLCHHVPDRLTALFQEAVRVVKPGGTILIDEANAYNVLWFVMMRLCEIDRIGTRPLFPVQLKRLARRYGLTVARERYWGFIPPFSEHRVVTSLFQRIESALEGSALRRLCVRYSVMFAKAATA